MRQATQHEGLRPKSPCRFRTLMYDCTEWSSCSSWHLATMSVSTLEKQSSSVVFCRRQKNTTLICHLMLGELGGNHYWKNEWTSFTLFSCSPHSCTCEPLPIWNLETLSSKHCLTAAVSHWRLYAQVELPLAVFAFADIIFLEKGSFLVSN